MKRAIESRTWLPSLRDNFLVNNNVDAISDIPSLESTYYVYVWNVWCKSGQFLNFFLPLTLNDLDLDQIWPHRNEPLKGNSRVSLHTLTKFCEIGPKDVGEKHMWPLGPNDLDICRNKPLKGNSGVSLHTRTNPVKCDPRPHIAQRQYTQ
jgi:hypothetical protein